MLTTTQEGTYTVELQKGSLTGTKTVTVARDASVTVDFSEFTTKATQRGSCELLDYTGKCGDDD